MRRNILRTFFAAVLLFTLFTVTAYAENAVLIGSGVNFRSGPGTNYYIIATLDKGTTVNVTNRSDPSWYAVSYGGQDGFIAASYLSFSSGSSSVPSYSIGGIPQPDGSYSSSASDSIFLLPAGSQSESGSANALPQPDNGSGVNAYGSHGSIVAIPNSGADSTPNTNPTPGTDNSYGTGNVSGLGPGQAGYVNAMYVRFRSGPGSNYSVLNEYNKGKTVSVYGSSGGWTACIIDGQRGYISSQYVTLGSYSGFTLGNPGTGSGNNYYSVPAVTPSPVPTQNVVQLLPAATPQPTAAPSASGGIPAYIVGSYVRFRSGAGTNYSILGSYNTGKAITVLQNVGNGWLCCVIDNTVGYVHGSYVLIMNQASYGGSSAPAVTATPTPTQAPSYTYPLQPAATPEPTPAQNSSSAGGGTPAYITGNNVRFRSSPSMTSNILTELFFGNEVTYYGTSGEWASISYQGYPGYVYASYVRSGSYSSSLGDAGSSGGVASGGSTATAPHGTGSEVANYALQFVGANYRWGGSSPETGFDCSGFVSYVYRQFGYNLNRVAQDQARNGVHVEPNAIQPGDILCFYSGSSYIGHVGIYIGGNRFVHASNSTTGVIISDLSGYYSTRGFEARRIIY